MGDFLGSIKAFAAELGKALESVPSAGHLSYTDALEITKMSKTIASSIEYYSSKLPSSASFPKILETAEGLSAKNHFMLARELHGYVLFRCPLALDGTDINLTRSRALEFEIRATLGLGYATALLALEEDPDMTLPDTLLRLRKSSEILRRGVAQALELEEHYWLAYNGTVHIAEVSRRVCAAGQHAEALPYLCLAAAALEGNIRLSLPRYLPWRCELYAAAVECYHALGATSEARRFLERGLSKVQELEDLQKLDPLPCPQEILGAYEAARGAMLSLRFGIAALAFKGEADASAALTQDFKTEEAQIRALLGAVRAPKRGAPASEGVKACVKLLEKRALPLLHQMEEGFVVRARGRRETTVTMSETGDVPAAAAAAPSPVSGADPSAAVSAEDEVKLRQLEAALKVITPPLHVKIVMDSFGFKEMALFDKAVAAGRARTGPGGDIRGASKLGHAIRVLHALRQFEGLELRFPDLEPALPLAEALSTQLNHATQTVGDILLEAALTLHRATAPIINRTLALNMYPEAPVQAVLQSLHDVFTAVGVSDPLTVADVDSKLGLVLEERQEEAKALSVLRAARARVEAHRCALLERHRHHPNEPYFALTADRSQPTEEVASLVSDMTEQERVLACLHADLLLALARMELRVGLTEQELQATRRVQRLEETLRRRDEQAAIFGRRTEKERREDEVRLAEAGATAPNPRHTEHRALSEADRNDYERALALIAMAEFREREGQEAALKECVETLHRIEKTELGLIRSVQAAQNPQTKVAPVPPAPQIVSRSRTSVTLVPPRGFRPRGEGRPTHFAIYGKAFGAGTSVQMNAIAAQHENLGVKFALGERCTVRGLKPNDSYTFAVAYFDEQGRVVGELGHSSAEIPMVLPLPIFSLWAKLAKTASRLDVLPVARHACAVLWRHFVVTRPDRPVWDANPMDAEELHPMHVAVAVPPVLRDSAQCAFILAERLHGDAEAAGGAGEGGGGGKEDDRLRRPYQEAEVASLRRAKRILIGLELAATVGDEGMVCEGAVRLYNCVGSLLAQRERSRLLFKALLGCYTALQAVADVTWCKRSFAGSVAIRTVYHLIDLCDEAGEAALRDHAARTPLPLVSAIRAYHEAGGGPGATREAAAAAAAAAGLGEINDEERALLDRQASELLHLTEFLLQHREAAAMATAAGAGGVFTLPDPKASADPLVKVLAQESRLPPEEIISQLGEVIPPPPAAWAAAPPVNPPPPAANEVRLQPRYVEALYRLCDRCYQRSRFWDVVGIADLLLAARRERAKVPRLPPSGEHAGYGRDGGRWSLEAALEAMQAEGAPPPPEAELELAGSIDKLAAARFIQKRWRACLTRRQALMQARERSARDAPWVARAMILAALSHVHFAKEKAEAASADAADVARGLSTRPAAPGEFPPPSPTKAADKKAGSPAPPPEIPIPDPNETLADGYRHVTLGLVAFARAAEFGARAAAPWELLNTCRRLHNSLRLLLGHYRDHLLAPVEKGHWAMRMPDGSEVPVTRPLPTGNAASPIGRANSMTHGPMRSESRSRLMESGNKPPSRTTSGRALSVDRSIDDQDLVGLEDQLDDDEEPQGVGRLFMVPAQPNPIRLLRVPAARLVQFIEKLKSGRAKLIEGVMPLSSSDAARLDATNRGTLPGGMTGGPPRSPRSTLRPQSAISSHFSFGSDLMPELWYASVSALDATWASKFILLMMNVMAQTGFPGAVFSAGDSFNKLTEGHFALDVLPLVKSSCAILGINLVPYQLALDAAIRDKNQALEELDRCRALVKSKLASRSDTAFDKDRATKKKKRAVNFKNDSSTGGKSATQSQYLETSSQARGTGAYGGSVYSFRTGVGRSDKPGGDGASILTAYKNVIEVLEAKGEKWLKAQALNELGDVHAHQGEWSEAGTAWSDALDLMMGPYQCVRTWREELAGLGPKDLLRRYGAPRVLLAIALLGKLAHYVHVADLAARLECAALGSELAHALFSCSVLHPQRKLDFSGYRPARLWAGQDLFSDPHQCPVWDLQFSTEVLARILLGNGLALDALPVVALMDHVARHVTLDTVRVAMCNVLRAEACTGEAKLREASAALLCVVLGLDLPDRVTGLSLPPPTTSGEAALGNNATSGGTALSDKDLYDPSHRPSHSHNKAVVERILNHALDPVLVKLYGPALAASVQGARAGFVRVACAEPDLFVDTDPVGAQARVPGADEAPPPAPATDAKKGLKGKETSKKALKVEEKPPPPRANRRGSTAIPEAAPNPTILDPATVFSGDVSSFEGQSLQGAVLLLKQSILKVQVAAGASSSDREQVELLAVLVRSEVALCELRRAQQLPAQALAHAAEALKILSSRCGPLLEIEGARLARAAPPELVARSALLGEAWCAATAHVAEILFGMGHVDKALEGVEGGLEAAAALKSERLSCNLLAVKARCLLSQGRTLEGLRELQALEGRMRRGGGAAPALDLATVLFEHGEVSDSLGLLVDSEALFAGAVQLLRVHLGLRGFYSPPAVPYAADPPAAGADTASLQHQHQLQARRLFDETLNLTVPGSALFVEALLRQSRAEFRRHRFQLAADLAREALEATPRARLPPQSHAACALQVARCLRYLALTSLSTAPEAGGDREAAMADLEAAVPLLHKSLRWAALDGGHLHDHLLRCYTELALCHLVLAEIGRGTAAAEEARGRALGAMLSALRTAEARDRLLLSPQTISVFKLEGAPVWALEAVRGRESVRPAVGQAYDPTDPALVGALLLRQLVALTRRESAHSWQLELLRRSQLAQLHRYLRATCPQYATECCITVPDVSGGSTPPSVDITVPGSSDGPQSIAFVWHAERDGCWGEEDAWGVTGTLEPSVKEESSLLSLRPPAPYVHVIAAIKPEAGGKPDVFTCTVALPVIHELHRGVQDLRLRAEVAAADPTMAASAPTAAELSSFVTELQVTLVEMLTKRRRDLGLAPQKGPDFGPEGARGADMSRLRQLEALLDVTRGAAASDAELAAAVRESHRSVPHRVGLQA